MATNIANPDLMCSWTDAYCSLHSTPTPLPPKKDKKKKERKSQILYIKDADLLG